MQGAFRSIRALNRRGLQPLVSVDSFTALFAATGGEPITHPAPLRIPSLSWDREAHKTFQGGVGESFVRKGFPHGDNPKGTSPIGSDSRPTESPQEWRV